MWSRHSVFSGFMCFALGFLTSCSSCVEQFDPSADHAKFKGEEKIANNQKPFLTDDGKIPAPAPKGGDKDKPAGNPVAQKYQTFCASCHGADGAANGAVAQAMNPKPRNLTDAAWQDSVDDARIAKVIKEGGASVGLSATMAPWGAMLNDDEITAMVKVVRGFKK